MNNAGRGLVGAAEEVTDDELRDPMDLHLFGPAALVRAVLPVTREQGVGTIVQMSSQAGRIAFPGVSAYSATKFAIEGWSESLAGEVAPFGVRVMIVEPSRFRTSFNTAEALLFAQESSTYGAALGALRSEMICADGLQEGDPVKAAQIIVSLAHGDDVPLRLPLGREAVGRLRTGHLTGLAELDRLHDLAISANFDDPASPPRSF
ncbi:SDR family NAD(P)-dependent oxidoreductase [Rhodococcus sp. H29-C3]|uniref:SDR family NAD(P)-dependent oxidoreductase n=1 Tax=Rhodococcus sp. H29-C3 TaxID=3046307 RepID=UPI0024BB71C0|nr:SDR family NAD(P)-dependent oxidoreductase [Rhodococcus sp. H29-C3]MDJ0362527.1 SDR family NAD(P)-dependent oxidoreductase [Rhodococcus sp. H29-C3]